MRSFVCGECSVEFSENPKPGRPPKFCSVECRKRFAVKRTAAWQKANPERTKVLRSKSFARYYAKNRATLIARSTARSATTDRTPEYERQKADRIASRPDRECSWCGESVPKTRKLTADTCSTKCNEARSNWNRKLAERTGVPLRHRVDRYWLFVRDEWVCGLCNTPVDRRLRYPNPMSASVDHIQPIVLGGTNDVENLQCAHLRCNISKRHFV